MIDARLPQVYFRQRWSYIWLFEIEIFLILLFAHSFLFPDCTPPLPGCLLMTCIALYLAPIQDQRQYACEEKGT